MSIPIIVIGAGGHSKCLLDTLLLLSENIIGMTDPMPDKEGQSIYGIKVIGNDDIIENYPADKVRLVNGMGSTQSLHKRKAIYDIFKSKGYSFAAVIHPSAVIAADVRLLEGVQVMAGAIIQPGTTIGHNSIINTRASIDHDCTIGAHVHIAPGVTLSGSIHIDDSAHVGAGTTIVQGIHVGKESLIGAGSVVIRDVGSNRRVFGVPAREG